MDLRQLLRTIRANLAWAVVAFLACVAIGGAAAFLPAKQYQATTTVLVQPPPDSPDPQGDVAVITSILPQLPIEATNARTELLAKALMPADLRGESVSLSASANPAADTLSVTVASPNPDAAAAYANAVVKVVTRLQPRGQATSYVLNQLSPALPPTSPTSQKKTILVAAVGFGLIAAVFAALAAAGIRRRFSSVDEIRERLGATILGQIPRLRSTADATGLFVNDNQPRATEAFLELRNNLLLNPRASEVMSIAVTSCEPSEGKTSMAANLAWVMAAAGRPVTAVDCDLRNPSLHLKLGVPFGPGLAGGPAVLVGRPPASPTPNLDVIPAGIPDRHPADVVSAYLPPLLDQLRERHRTVIVDCPPVNGAAETVIVAARVDMVVVVVDARRFNPDRLKQALTRLDLADAEVVGVVINRVRSRNRRFGGRHYDYYPYGGAGDDRGRPRLRTPMAVRRARPDAPADPWDSSRRDAAARVAGPTGADDDRVAAPGAVAAVERGSAADRDDAEPAGRGDRGRGDRGRDDRGRGGPGHDESGRSGAGRPDAGGPGASPAAGDEAPRRDPARADPPRPERGREAATPRGREPRAGHGGREEEGRSESARPGAAGVEDDGTDRTDRRPARPGVGAGSPRQRQPGG